MDQLEHLASIAQDHLDKEAVKNPQTQAVLAIVRDFIASKRVLCYGGTAINNLLPKKDQFYDTVREIPDYDFFSATPQLHAMELADELAKTGLKSIEVKPGMHMGTFKVFAAFSGVADITYLDPRLFERLWKESIEKADIRYVPPNFLRMSVYLELSRPRGDVSRWTKVYSRIQKLNKEYPILCPSEHEDMTEAIVPKDVRTELEDAIVREKMILLGFNASTIQQQKSGRPAGEWKLPLDVLVPPDVRAHASETFKNILSKYAEVSVRENPPFEELLPASTDIIDTKSGLVAARIYETNACHSYHEMSSGLRVASIPTLLQFFLAALYGDDEVRTNIPEQRFMCTAQHLIEMANDDVKRRYKILTPIECVGTQDSIIDLRIKKSIRYTRALEKGKRSKSYLRYFFTYDPLKATDEEKAVLKERLKSLAEHHSN